MSLLKLRKFAQVTLPADLRKKFNLAEGDFLEAEAVEKGILPLASWACHTSKMLCSPYGGVTSWLLIHQMFGKSGSCSGNGPYPSVRYANARGWIWLSSSHLNGGRKSVPPPPCSLKCSS